MHPKVGLKLQKCMRRFWSLHCNVSQLQLGLLSDSPGCTSTTGVALDGGGAHLYCRKILILGVTPGPAACTQGSGEGYGADCRRTPPHGTPPWALTGICLKLCGVCTAQGQCWRADIISNFHCRDKDLSRKKNIERKKIQKMKGKR